MSYFNPNGECPCGRYCCGCTDDDIELEIDAKHLIWGIIDGQDWLLPPHLFPNSSPPSSSMSITIGVKHCSVDDDDDDDDDNYDD